MVAKHHVERQLHRLERLFEFFRELGIIHAGDTGFIDIVTQTDDKITTRERHITHELVFALADAGDGFTHRILTGGATAGIADHDKPHGCRRVAGHRIVAPVITAVSVTRLGRIVWGFRIPPRAIVIGGVGTGRSPAAAGSQRQCCHQGQQFPGKSHDITSLELGTGGWKNAVRSARGREGGRSSTMRLSTLFTATTLVLPVSIWPRRSKDSMLCA